MKTRKIIFLLITIITTGLIIACGKTKVEETEIVIEDAKNEQLDSQIVEPSASSVPIEVTTDVENAFPDVNVNANISLDDDNDIHKDDVLQIVFLGDSIIDNFRDETGIAYLVGKNLDANVYNLGIGGASASVKRSIMDWSDEGLKDLCGVTVTNIMAGKVPIDYLIDCTTKKIIEEHMGDFANTDIFVVEYGINDFLYGRDRTDEKDRYSPITYEGAMRRIIENLRKVSSNAKIVLCHPSYIELYRENGEYVGNSYVLDNGLGSECDYGNLLEFIAGDCDTYFWPLADQGPGLENANDTLLDGVHLNETGRKLYADNLSNYLNKIINE